MRILVVTALMLSFIGAGAALAQTSASPTRSPKPTPTAARPGAPEQKAPAAAAAGIATEPGFTIGSEDVLGILFWRDADMSSDVTVRPDGMVTLPLVRDVKAAGLTTPSWPTASSRRCASTSPTPRSPSSCGKSTAARRSSPARWRVPALIH